MSLPPASPPTESVYLALLRGINVGGHRKVAMPALKALCLELGYRDVQTYIQSGNVVFRSTQTDPAHLTAQLEAALEHGLEVPVQVAVRSRAELWQALVGNPYPEQATQDGSRVHLALLSAEPDAEGLASLQAVPRGPDNWALHGRSLYLSFPNGAGRTRLDHGTLERRLGVSVTVRNWNTVQALGRLLNAL